jgi:hypothetical protein
VTFHALERRKIAEIYRMLEWLVCFVAGLTLSIRQTAKVDRMLEVLHLADAAGLAESANTV